MAVNIDYRVVAMLYVSMCKTNSKICLTYDFKLSSLNKFRNCFTVLAILGTLQAIPCSKLTTSLK